MDMDSVDKNIAPLVTDDVTIVTHTHGRERRVFRGIDKHDLQSAIKNGVKESANPGKGGSERFRFTYKNIVCITDHTCKHEITSWRLDEGDDELPLHLESFDGRFVNL